MRTYLSAKKAKKAVDKGHRVTHRLFPDNQYIVKHQNNIVTEDNEQVPEDTYWKFRSIDEFEEEWFIYGT